MPKGRTAEEMSLIRKKKGRTKNNFVVLETKDFVLMRDTFQYVLFNKRSGRRTYYTTVSRAMAQEFIGQKIIGFRTSSFEELGKKLIEIEDIIVSELKALYNQPALIAGYEKLSEVAAKHGVPEDSDEGY